MEGKEIEEIHLKVDNLLAEHGIKYYSLVFWPTEEENLACPVGNLLRIHWPYLKLAILEQESLIKTGKALISQVNFHKNFGYNPDGS